MDKKIASELALGVIIFLAVVVGGVFFLQSRSAGNPEQSAQSIPAKTPAVQATAVVADSSTKQDAESCEAHYYEGDQQIHVWPVAEPDENSDGLVVSIKAEDAKMLPVKQVSENADISNFTVKLVDASKAVSKKIADASRENPAVITIKGYAEVCEEPPLVSLQPATVAFKKG